MATHKLPVYPADHPVALALRAMFSALATGGNLLDALVETATDVGVKPFSDEFDEAAAMAGLPYSRAWDAYLDRETWALAESRPLAHVH
ncbi:TPA: hypothetical protein SAO13_001386 [Burkholderia multivorans]|uniref:hypothetical protein n=1 Tax=Burkholderia multivorans TaxID=87883 RepID=UPI00158FB3B3|nr:hypothetical protein [Burkholderia multivorans]MBU9238747.1 hypothetical protein [Burkholderia multivorans]HEF4747428.1 hypothetical protein [Burkholderia multivorans]